MGQDRAQLLDRTQLEDATIGALGRVEDIGFNPMKASSELWAFLNLNVTGNGRNKFDAAQELTGWACGTA